MRTKVEDKRNRVIEEALDHPELSSRELAVHIVDQHKWYVSESSVYRILKEAGLLPAQSHILLCAANEYQKKTSRVNEMWQTDFTYFKIIGWGWYYLSTVLDDYSRYIIAWDLRSNMTAEDVKPSILRALQVTGLSINTAPTLLSDNGPCYISSEFKSFLKEQGIFPINGKPCHPQTQGKIERYHRTMKNVIKLENYYSPEELERAVAQFVEHYNSNRYHESLKNLTPGDVFHGNAEKILRQRAKIKQKTMKERRVKYLENKCLELVA